ncbi:glycosyltransferase [bacterium]|nr:glycosyltransferase [bacterium]
MRFVIVGPVYPIRGGIAQSVTQLYKTLCDSGHSTHVLSFKRLYPSVFFPGKTPFESGKALYKIPSNALLDSVNPWTWIQSIRWLKSLQPDALIFQYWMPFFIPCYIFIAFISKLFWGIRSIYICHNIVPHERIPGDLLLLKLGFRFTDGLITQSASVRNELMKIYPNQRTINTPHPIYNLLPHPVSKMEARKKLGIKRKRLILYFGIIRSYKGIQYLVKAMPIILQKESVHCLICGEFYDDREDTFKLIQDLNLGSRILVRDEFIPNESVHLYFCAADIVVLPYLTATQSGVVQVAFNYNRPVVVTRVGGLPEVVLDGKTGYIVPPKDPGAIAKAVLQFYLDCRTVPFEKNIRSEKKKYSWKRMGEAVEMLAKPDNVSLNS